MSVAVPKPDPSQKIREAKALVSHALEALHPLRGEERMFLEEAMEKLRAAQRDLEDALR